MANFSSKKLIITIAATVLVATAIAVTWAMPYFYSTAGAQSTLKIRPTTDMAALTDSLSRYYEADFARRTVRVLGWMDVNLPSRCGLYTVGPDDSPLTLARKIRNREQTPVKFTFNNLRLKEQFAQRASEVLMLQKHEMLALLESDEVCQQYGKTQATIINTLLPDTYEVYWDISAEDLLAKLHRHSEQFWNDSRRAEAQALGLTPDQVHTIASIVEEETAKADEYGKVARLYINRLQRGMLLQSDPTVKYAMGDFTIRRITNAMLETRSPYNTYLNAGLPPGPIRIASKRAIDAVLDAPEHNYIYMCAREDFSGYHNFTASYSQHLVNARRYHAALNRRGIK